METIQNYIRSACSVLKDTPLACDQTAAAFQWWHVYFGALVFLVVAGAVAFYRVFISRKGKTPDLTDMLVSGGRQGAERTLYLHPRTVARLLDLQADRKMGQKPLVQKLRKNTENKDFFVRIIEIYPKANKTVRKEVLHSVLKIVPVAYHVGEAEVQLDVKSLNEVRARNYSLDDDNEEPTDGVLGRYEVYVRPTRKTDVGYWLTHPNRDVRYPIWGAIIATLVEYSSPIGGVAQALWKTFV